MRAVVTGGAGFIGSHVVEALLARGDEVHVLDDLSKGKPENVPSGAELHEADIRAPDAVFDAVRPEAVFHLAAQADVRTSVERPDYDADVNVLGTLRILEAARRHDAQVVFASTGRAIYGECDGPAPETAERRPLAPPRASRPRCSSCTTRWSSRAASSGSRATPRRGSASSSAACSTCRSPNASSAGGRRPRSPMGSPRRGSGSGRSRTRGRESIRAMQH